MKPFDYYNTPKTSYPNKVDYTTVFVYNKGKVVWQGSKRNFKSNDFPKDAVVQNVINEEDYSAHKDAYNEDSSRLMEEFVLDLFDEFNVLDNSKAALCYQKAYEIGHAYGLQEVYNVFDDLVELIK
jgi:ribonuclease HIII